MTQITLVTGNKNKLLEFQKILKNINLKNKNIDLDEIQSLSLKEICEHKVKQAYKIIKSPVLIEDSGFFIDELNNLPGPFIKFFEKQLGNGAAIKLIGNATNRKAKHICAIAYYDGTNLIIKEGILNGTITKKLKSGEGFGFDYCFIPDGYNKTLSQLGLEIKNTISARKLAIEQFKDILNN